MHGFLLFLKRKLHLILFLFIEALALYAMYLGNDYHRMLIWGWSNDLRGNIASVQQRLDRYRGLYDKNLDLMKENAVLEKEVLRLKAVIERYSIDSLRIGRYYKHPEQQASLPFEYSVAEIVNRSNLSHSYYYTINKGEQDGLSPDMGVLSSKGVVGVVVSVGKHYAKVMPLINPKFILNCKLGNSPYTGSLQWDGIDTEHSVLKNLPKHAKYSTGDSIFTSGYSTLFPEGVNVGTVVGPAKSEDDSFLALRVRFSTPFSALKYVYLVELQDKAVLDSLEAIPF